MTSDKVQASMMLGFQELDNINKKKIMLNDLFPENIRHFCFVKSIKMWFGSPPDETKVKSLLGIQVLFLN